MVINGLDLNYLGVSNVWNNDMGTPVLTTVHITGHC